MNRFLKGRSTVHDNRNFVMRESGWSPVHIEGHRIINRFLTIGKLDMGFSIDVNVLYVVDNVNCEGFIHGCIVQRAAIVVKGNFRFPVICCFLHPYYTKIGRFVNSD